MSSSSGWSKVGASRPYAPGATRIPIERQLAHVQGNKVRGAYNHAEYLPERRKMMQWWADYLDQLATKKVPTHKP